MHMQTHSTHTSENYLGNMEMQLELKGERRLKKQNGFIKEGVGEKAFWRQELYWDPQTIFFSFMCGRRQAIH